ncbi:MAG: hypothetical protein ACRDUY_02585 [Nitriliruptorales bacterium]
MPFVGVLLILIGAASAFLPLVGPLFGFEAGGEAAWVLTTERVVGHVLPGAAAVIGGIMMLPAARSSRIIGSFIALLAGVWLTLSPAVYGTPLTLPGTGGELGDPVQVGALLVYHFGAGLLVTILAAIALGAGSGSWVVERRVGRVRLGSTRPRDRREEPVAVPDEEPAREEERAPS